MRIAMAQINPTVGDFSGNIDKIARVLEQTGPDRPALIVFPELVLTGYAPRDFLERKDFVEAAGRALDRCIEVSKRIPGAGLLIGTIRPTGRTEGNGLYNSAVLIQNGKILMEQNKTLLPSYDVFDESRYFDPAPETSVFAFGNEKLGITICEDAWNDGSLRLKKTYASDPVRSLVQRGATVLINLSASPFYVGKETIRIQLASSHARKYGKPFLLVNQIGGNDELVFDGQSFAMDAEGNLILLFPSFQEHVRTIDLAAGNPVPFLQSETEISMREALILGLRDYMRKCGFKTAVLGLSGGIDSALVCCLAAEAVGPQNVLGIAMPSPYSSKESLEDAEALAGNLGVAFKVIPITPLFHSYLDSLKGYLDGTAPGLAEENIQARIRGNLLMAFSNKFGHLTLSTGNKSELSVGYCTLYGDMSGGLSVIADVPKTWVYRIAKTFNRKTIIIPQRCFTKPPSAELRPNQKDQDSLPPYETLDVILELYLEQGLSKDEIVARNFNGSVVDWVVRAVNTSEYKRRQAAPGLKLFPKAFGMGRRMPIAAKF